jgi:hypothetical protein
MNLEDIVKRGVVKHFRPGMNLFIYNNNTYRVINVVSFKIDSLGLETIVRPFEAFYELYFWNSANDSCDYTWLSDIIKFSLSSNLNFGKRNKSHSTVFSA